MRTQHQIDDYQRALHDAEQILGEPIRPFNMDWRYEQLVRKYGKSADSFGFGTQFPLLHLSPDPNGRRVSLGIESFTLDSPSGQLRLARIVPPQTYDSDLGQVWVTPIDQYETLQKQLRRLERKRLKVDPPIMKPEDKDALWKNSVSFLTHGQEVLKKYNVARKRGILLLGEPGNGKTTACKWLHNQCRQKRLRWRNVNAQDYTHAFSQGNIANLFRMPKPGVVLFDDFDQALWDRGSYGADSSLATFLTELDGVQPQEGVVYIFTTNARLQDLDPAFRRPGRIDLVVEFKRPTSDLRRDYIESRWHEDIRNEVDIDEVVSKTHTFSFAELEELRKLMVLHFVDHGQWDWNAAWSIYESNRPKVKSSQPIGFQMKTSPVTSSTTVANG